jgi:hypothetical protein
MHGWVINITYFEYVQSRRLADGIENDLAEKERGTVVFS